MSEYKQQVINFFDKRTAYDSEGRGHPENAKKLLDFVPIQSGQTILDLATGTGVSSNKRRQSTQTKRFSDWC